ncbi:hypothetical protein ACIQZB_13450 [Streptomyces sp. NPDC097727]|uniref:hypothetical protein n=1 Tax=Streptomyces sp. NPDC097727 TaxID=3366092 RepID=UPI00382360E1
MGAAHLSALGAIGLQRPQQSVRREQGAAPLIDLSLLRSRPFLASSADGLFTGLSVIGLFSCLPTLFRQAPGMSAPGSARLFLRERR